jgi:hypothetical protein
VCFQATGPSPNTRKISGKYSMPRDEEGIAVERSKGITFYGIAIIAFGVYNLLGVGNFKQFSLMFKGLSQLATIVIYVFTILYGICGVYCGTKILKLEDWARKVIVGVTSISVILGLLLNRMVMSNFKQFLLSEQSGITPDLFGTVYKYAIALTVLVTLFELSVIFYFTRPDVVKQFKPHEEIHTA